MSEVDAAVAEIKEDLTSKLSDLTAEVKQMQVSVDEATTLEELQKIRYGGLLDAAGEIETTIDAIPEDVDVEEDDDK